MLEELSIKNFALIEQLSLEFDQGFTVFTGETGAGKSILAGAIGLLAGSRGSADQIRTGVDEAEINAIFHLGRNRELGEWLEARDLSPEEGRLYIRRILRRSGKNTQYIQGSPCSLKDLVELSEYLFDMHGQHEHQTLFETRFHRKYLDDFAGLGPQVELMKQRFLDLSSLKKRHESLVSSQEERERERELLRYSLHEIEQARILPGEDQELESERSLLESSEDLKANAQAAYEALHDEEGGALGALYQARTYLGKLGILDEACKDWAERLTSQYYELEDLATQLGHYRDRVIFDPERLEAVQERLDLLFKLKKKYGGSLASLEEYRVKAAEDLDKIENYSEHREALATQIQDLEKEVQRRSQELSTARKAAAEQMEAQVLDALKGLRMGKTSFKVEVQQRRSEKGSPLYGPFGMDEIEFLLAANPGEPLKPLRSVASGGEISRVMLAIKSVLSDIDGVDTLIFDEIDSGIGGEVGLALGEYLHKTAGRRQLLAITHLASIAVRADNHIRIQKAERDGRTYTQATHIAGQERVVEIARMLAGHAEHSTSLAHARELLEKYQVQGVDHGQA